MKIALIGASGFIGSAILKEALARDHHVTALIRHPEKLTAHTQLTSVKIDVHDQAGLTQQLRGHDAVISAFSGHSQHDVYTYNMQGMTTIINAVKKTDINRFLVVGGAGSLEIKPGMQLIDSPDFPPAYHATAEGARTILHQLREEPTLKWTMLSPSAVIIPGALLQSFSQGVKRVATYLFRLQQT